MHEFTEEEASLLNAEADPMAERHKSAGGGRGDFRTSSIGSRRSMTDRFVASKLCDNETETDLSSYGGQLCAVLHDCAVCDSSLRRLRGKPGHPFCAVSVDGSDA